MFVVFVFNDTATTEIYTLSLHDALPIYVAFLSGSPELLPPEARDPNFVTQVFVHDLREGTTEVVTQGRTPVVLNPSLSGEDRKSTRLNSSHANISYAVFCLKKKRKDIEH